MSVGASAQVVVCCADDTLTVIDGATGHELFHRPIPTGRLFSARALPSGDVLAISSQWDVYLLPTVPGRDVVTLFTDATHVIVPTTTPDIGRACVTGDRDGNVRVWELDGHSRR